MKKKSAFSKAELDKIRENLPAGSYDVLAKKFSLKATYVQNILTGHSTNDDVVLSAMDIVREYNEKIKQAQEALHQL